MTYRLHNSNHLLTTSLDPDSNPRLAPTAFIGPPSSHPQPPQSFTALLQTKWNKSISSAINSISFTNFTAIRNVALGESTVLAEKASEEASHLAVRAGEIVGDINEEVKKDVRAGLREMKRFGRGLGDVGREVKRFGEDVVRQVEGAKEEIETGVVKGDLRSGESFVGGPEAVVRTQREMERRVEGRLV